MSYSIQIGQQEVCVCEGYALDSRGSITLIGAVFTQKGSAWFLGSSEFAGSTIDRVDIKGLNGKTAFERVEGNKVAEYEASVDLTSIFRIFDTSNREGRN